MIPGQMELMPLIALSRVSMAILAPAATSRSVPGVVGEAVTSDATALSCASAAIKNYDWIMDA